MENGDCLGGLKNNSLLLNSVVGDVELNMLYCDVGDTISLGPTGKMAFCGPVDRLVGFGRFGVGLSSG